MSRDRDFDPNYCGGDTDWRRRATEQRERPIGQDHDQDVDTDYTGEDEDDRDR